MTKSYVYLPNARFPDQRAQMEKIEEEGVCPFCAENLARFHDVETLKTGKYWLVTYNQYPRENTKLHLLIIYIPHAENLSQIDPEAGPELIEFLAWIEKEFNIEGGAFFLRFGDPAYSSASVIHLHIQFVVPDRTKPNFEPVRFKVG